MKKLGSVIVALSLAVLFGGWFWLSPFSGSLVRLDPPLPGLGNQFEMRIERLDPPALFHGTNSLSENPPFWAQSRFWAIGLDRETVSKRFDDLYIRAYGEPKLGLEAPNIFVAVYYGIAVKAESGEFLLVASSYAESQNALSAENPGLSVLKRYGDTWKRTAPPEWIGNFPWNKLDVLEEILRQGAAKIDAYNQLIPSQ